MTYDHIAIIILVIVCWHHYTAQDFKSDQSLKTQTLSLVEEMMSNCNLLPAEYKSTDVIIAALNKSSEEENVDSLLIGRLIANEEVPI